MGIFSNFQKTQDLIFGRKAKRVVKGKRKVQMLKTFFKVEFESN